MSDFTTYRLGDIGKIVTGKTPPTNNEENFGNEYMFLGPVDLHKHFIIYESEKMISEKGLQSIKGSILDDFSILIGCIGWDMGNVSLVHKKCATNQQINSITNIKKIFNPYYIYYWLKCKKSFLFQQSNVTRTPILNKTDLSNLTINIPNKDIQNKVANLLTSLDKKIELNNKINKELESMAKILYDYWFVQFDFPDVNGKPYKSSGGKMVYNQELKREIPERWEIGCIGDYCKSTGGFAFKSSWWTEKGVSVIKIKDIQENYTIDISNLSKVDLSNKKIDDKFKAEAGNVLIAMTGATVGKYAIVPITDNSIYINQRVGYFNLGKEPTKKLPYFINSLNQSYFREMIFTLASGAAQPNISNEQINNIKLLIPKKDIVENFNNKLSSFYKLILNNQQQNQELAKLRDWLLPMLMNGQVRVK